MSDLGQETATTMMAMTTAMKVHRRRMGRTIQVTKGSLPGHGLVIWPRALFSSQSKL
jgi:hypothetical protein